MNHFIQCSKLTIFLHLNLIAENEIRLLKAEFDGQEDRMTSLDRSRLERLEQQVRLLGRRRHDLEQSAKTFVNRCILICRPFQFILGSIFTLFGFLIFLSLLLTCIDRAINSLGKLFYWPTKSISIDN